LFAQKEADYLKQIGSQSKTITKFSSQMQVLSSVDQMVASLKTEIDKYSHVINKKEETIKSLGAELEEYKHCYKSIEDKLLAFESNYHTKLQEFEHLKQWRETLESRTFSNAFVQTPIHLVGGIMQEHTVYRMHTNELVNAQSNTDMTLLYKSDTSKMDHSECLQVIKIKPFEEEINSLKHEYLQIFKKVKECSD